MDQIGTLIKKLEERARQRNLKLWGIGIAICGMVNKNTGIVEYSPIFDWFQVDVRKALSSYTSLDIALGNVVHLIALGELLYGVGQLYTDFICINLGYGIGSGIISNRRLFTGADGIAGEIGHIIIDSKTGRKGMEGISGTLEALASGYGIADIARELSLTDKESVLHSLDPADIDAKSVFDAAKNGDHLSVTLIDSVAKSISIGIDTLIKLFNPECIVLTGGLILNGDYLINKIRKELQEFSMNAVSRKVPVITSGFGENAALMGSFSLTLEKILHLEKQPDKL